MDDWVKEVTLERGFSVALKTHIETKDLDIIYEEVVKSSVVGARFFPQ